MMKRRDFLFFFFVPFMGVLAIFYLFSSINRSFIERKASEVVSDQLKATALIIKNSAKAMFEHGMEAEKVMSSLFSQNEIYYLALLDNGKQIVAWSSRYEGYLPFSGSDIDRREPWTINSPVGEIFNLITGIELGPGNPYYLYLGYSMSVLEELRSESRKNFLVLFLFIVGAGLLLFLGISQMQRSYIEKKAEAESERSEKEYFREISAWGSLVAHEVKNPLNSLALLFEILARRENSAFSEEISLGRGEVQKISRIVDLFSQALKPISPGKDQVCLSEIVASSARQLFEGVGGRIAFGYQESEPAIFITGDQELFRQAFFNLLRNAVEATREGRISVTARLERKTVTIDIKDSGEGVAPAISQRLFTPFISSKKEGLGLGLYLVRKIVEAHSGKISIKETGKEGTVFEIKLPGGKFE